MSRGRVRDDTLVPLLAAEAVPMPILHERYGPLLELVRVLIGVVPKCDTYLEIWPPAFRTYNVMVPNFLDLPFSVLGVGHAPRDMVGLGLYVASRAAECPYCSAHTCSFALRRGAILETVSQALDPGKPFSPREQATIAVARSLGRIPCELTHTEKRALEAQFTPEEVEWVVFGVVMMGFLNKFMDAVGVELEPSTVAETMQVMGGAWSAGKADSDLPDDLQPTPPPSADTVWTKLAMLPKLPKALSLDAKWQRGVPDAWPAVGAFLEARTGHPFPILARIKTKRAIRAVGTMLRENLDPTQSKVGLPIKVLAGIIFCAVIDDALVADDVKALAQRSDVSAEEIEAAHAFAMDPEGLPPGASERAQALLALAKAASPSPAEITPEIVSRCREAGLSPAELVELVSWIAVLQMLHRLTAYFAWTTVTARSVRRDQGTRR